MASSIFCEPDSTPIQTSAQPARSSASTVVRDDEVGAGLNFEWKQVRHRIRTAMAKASYPMAVESENIVTKPDVLDSVEVFN